MKKNKKSVLEQTAPVYVTIIVLLYAGFLIYWRHTSRIGNQVNWSVWIVLSLILLLLPLAFVLNQLWEDSNKAGAVNDLARIRRMLGLLLLPLPFILMTLEDTTREFQNYYTSHVYAAGESPVPAQTLFFVVNGGSFLLGSFLIFLGRGKLFSSVSLPKLIAAAIITVVLMIALLLYSFARYYQF